MSKEIPVIEAELAALMDDLESMLATDSKTPEPAPTVPVAAQEPFKEPEKVSAPWEEELPEVTPAETRPEPAPEPVAELPEVTPAPLEPELDEAPPTTPPARAPVYFVDVPQFQRDIAIGSTNMDQAMASQASLRAYYGSLAAQAEGHAAALKAKFEILEAKLHNEHEKELVASGKKATVAQIEAAVKCDPRWFAGKSKVIEAETIANVNKGLTFALADRRDMLIQLGSDRREEMKGQLRITNGNSAETQTKLDSIASKLLGETR